MNVSCRKAKSLPTDYCTKYSCDPYFFQQSRSDTLGRLSPLSYKRAGLIILYQSQLISRKVLKMLNTVLIHQPARLFIHVSPRQLYDQHRKYIKKEHDEFLVLLQKHNIAFFAKLYLVSVITYLQKKK